MCLTARWQPQDTAEFLCKDKYLAPASSYRMDRMRFTSGLWKIVGVKVQDAVINNLFVTNQTIYPKAIIIFCDFWNFFLDL